jgi:hypothetical protein
LFALIAVASAAPQHYYDQPELYKSYQPATVVKQLVQPIVKKIEYAEEPANYDFEYSVHDDHTGDIKQQHESAKNGAVEGYYSLIDADGYRRIVHYTADDHHGFNAEVRREPVEGHKIIKTVQPVTKIIAQPAIAVQKYVVPQTQYYQQAPIVQKYVAPQPQYYQQAPIVQKYVAPQPQYVQKVAVAAPVKYTSAENSAHVSFNGPSSNYHY